jgi:hypothetical protein
MRLRLLKVICQPVFVVDDGENLLEQAAEPVVVPAAEWPTYPTEGFARSFEILRVQMEATDFSDE